VFLRGRHPIAHRPARRHHVGLAINMSCCCG
jgi:hypothetical protein